MELRKAAELDPSQADPHYTLGVIFWQQGDFAAAAKELRAAIHARPDYAEAYYTLGTVLKQKGRAPGIREGFAGSHSNAAGFCRGAYDAGSGAPPAGRRSEGAAAEAAPARKSPNRKAASKRLFATNSRTPVAENRRRRRRHFTIPRRDRLRAKLRGRAL